MELKKILFSKHHLANPFSHTQQNGEILSISDKKVRVIALSILTGVFTLGIGGVFLFYFLSAKYKIEKIENHLAIPKINFFSRLPGETVTEIYNFLSPSELNNLAKVNRILKDRANYQIIKRAQKFGYDQKSIKTENINNYLLSLFRTVRGLAKEKILPNSKIAYHKETNFVDAEKTLENLSALRIDELMHIFRGNRIYGKENIGMFNKVLSKSHVEQVDHIDVRELSRLLSEAVKAGATHIAKLLLVQGAVPNVIDDQGFTPLISSAKKGCFFCVSLLLSHKAEPNIPGGNGSSPLHFAAQEGHDDIVDLLLDHGAEIDALGLYGNSALLFATIVNLFSTVKLLLLRGADPNIPNGSGSSPLHFAAQKGHDDIVELLLDHGAEIDALGWGGQSALLFATKAHRSSTVRLLLSRGADHNSRG